MKIRETFNKSIDRHISGVIKIGNEEENKQQELEEYVVTQEISKYFRQFFERYTMPADSTQREIGVWISGFYGSGKSHFMKILSYILDNQTVNGKRPVDYFKEDGKGIDPLTLIDMEKAAEMSSDVILFDIESMSMDKNSSKEAVLQVFERVFNDKLGYDGAHPSIAEAERYMDNMGLYDAFKAKYKELTNKEWKLDRKNIKFRRRQFIKAITSLDVMAEEDATKIVDNVHEPYRGSVSDFAKIINEYCEKKGPGHRVIFMSDETGQYIGDDIRLMINLQTLSEDFSTYCKGKAWIVVTSQQNIDEVVHVQGEDFSKIQARFKTRLSLSSSDVSVVIQKRILEKNQSSKYQLSNYYKQKESIIKNLIDFSDEGRFKQKYTNAENFVDVYPFIPYQFDLLRDVLEQIRIHSSSGKHLAEGERSMLALIQESAQSVASQEIGTLVSFNKFYISLEQWIDHTYRNVIDQAARNPQLEPFDVEILKVLYMIKYVKEINADIKNVTTLMVSHVDEDRVDLTKKVEESLKRLVKQTYVQKDGNYYSFLTNAEQEQIREINAEKIENSRIVAKMKEIIFGELYPLSKFRFSPRYNFSFNQRIDDTKFVTNHSIELMIVTPYNVNNYTIDELRPLSGAENIAIFKLPNEIDFQGDLIYSLKLEQYLLKHAGDTDENYRNLQVAKQNELQKVNMRTRQAIEAGLCNADILVNGDFFTPKSKDLTNRINDSLSKLVDTVYFKLRYMTTSPEPNDFAKIFAPQNMSLSGIDNNDNQLALNDLVDFITSRTAFSERITYKRIQEVFTNRPYGFINNDIHWLVMKLLSLGTIDLTLNGSLIKRTDPSATIIRTVTDNKNADKIIITLKPIISQKQIRDMNDLCHEIDSSFNKVDDSDILNKRAKEMLNIKIDELNQYLTKYGYSTLYPGKERIEKLLNHYKTLYNFNNPTDFFKYGSEHFDDILGCYDDFGPVETFFNGPQKELFDRGRTILNVANKSTTYLSDHKEIKDTVDAIYFIIHAVNPFNKFNQLKNLIGQYDEAYNKLLDSIKDEQNAELDMIELQLTMAAEEVDEVMAQVANTITETFTDYRNRIKNTNDISEVYSIVNSEAKFKRGNILLEINELKKKYINKPTDSFTVSDLFNDDIVIASEAELDQQLNIIKRKLLKSIKDGRIVKIKTK